MSNYLLIASSTIRWKNDYFSFSSKLVADGLMEFELAGNSNAWVAIGFGHKMRHSEMFVNAKSVF